MTNHFFLLFTSCIPVKGIKNSVIMDLDRGTYIEIPNLLYDVLALDLQSLTVKEVMKSFDHQYDKGIQGYFQYLVDNQYGFFTKNPAPFRKPKDVFYSPYKVISSVLALDQNSNYDLKSLVNQLERLSCQLLQIRIYEAYDLDMLIESLEPLEGGSIKICEIYLHYDSIKTEEQLKKLSSKYPNVIVIVHSSPLQKQIDVSEESAKKIVFTKNKITSKTKEVYDPSLFAISHSMYYEAKHFNAGLHRKVCVDVDGAVKNYLSHEKTYGNVKEVDISSVVSKPEFQEKYFITNDQIEKCKNCQFRYMCLSNSDIIKKNGRYFKKHSCSFEE